MKTQNHPDLWWTERLERTELRARPSVRSKARNTSTGSQIWVTTFFIVALVPVVGLCMKAASGWGG